MVKLPTLSIVIPAYNEKKVIEKCLIPCVNQDERVDEIIVVEYNSVHDIAKNAAEKLETLYRDLAKMSQKAAK